MKPITLFRKMHRWATLIIGVQAVLWTLGGVYMTVIPLPIIHGKHMMSDVQPAEIDWARVDIDPGLVLLANPDAHHVRLTMFDGEPVYQVMGERHSLISAETGKVVSPVSEESVRRVARTDFAGDAEIIAVSLIEEDVPLEIQNATPPLWRVDFAGWNQPSFFYSAETGQFVSRRHNLWRGFDIAWMFHIMDYKDRTDMDNWLLRIMTAIGFFSALAGMGLLIYRLGGRKRPEAAR